MPTTPETQVYPDLPSTLHHIWQVGLIWSRRHDVRAALIATLALRIVCSAIAALLTFLNPASRASNSILDIYITRPLLHWDASWYLEIAEHGYHASGSTAFMPVYPLLIRVIGTLLGGNLPLAALLISTLSTFGAFLCLYRIVTRLTTVPHAADWTLVTAALLPVSFFLMAGYTEALFLWLALAAILKSQEKRWALAGGLSALAALTRHQGVFLPIVFLPGLLSQSRVWPSLTGQEVSWRQALHMCFYSVFVVLAAPVSYFLWWFGVVDIWFHAPLPWGPEILPNGWYLHSTWPGAGILADVAALVQNKVPNPLVISLPLDIAMAVLGGFSILFAARRFPLGIVFFAIVCWCLALLKVQTSGLTISTARYLLPLLPFLLIPAELLAKEHKILRLTWLSVAGVLFVLCIWLFADGMWIS